MLPERIVTLRKLANDATIECSDELTELLQAFESAQAEIAHVRGIMEAGEMECRHREEQDRVYRTKITILENQIADLKRGGVVVPELTDTDIDAIWRDTEDIGDAARAMARWAYSLAASRARAITADRELGEGKVVVDLEELAALERVRFEALDLKGAFLEMGEFSQMEGITRALHELDVIRDNQERG